ncbi:hypothetical protein KVP97_17450, partial [Escherichia coli]|nr:hypothetical protein [Escherichia coli]
QKDIAEKIQKQGGDYLFAVKGNQGRLNKAFEEKVRLTNSLSHRSQDVLDNEKMLFFLAGNVHWFSCHS